MKIARFFTLLSAIILASQSFSSIIPTDISTKNAEPTNIFTLQLNKTRLTILQGNILQQPVQAIVNAAKPTLLGVGGIDGALHAAAGPELREYCEQLPEIQPGVRCPIGKACITPSFNIGHANHHIKHIIHTVGPRGSNPNREQLLTDAYKNSLRLAAENNIRTIALPAISAGIYGYDIHDSAPIAIQTIKLFIAFHPDSFDEIRLVSLSSDFSDGESFFSVMLHCLRK